MKYLPYENITYRTKLDPQEIEKKLLGIIEPKKTFRLKGIFSNKKHKPYEGSLDSRSFSIKRIIHYKNSFLPKIKGTIERDSRGAKVSVTMRLNPFVLVFMVIWLFVAGLIISSEIPSYTVNQTFDSTQLIPLGMFIFGYALVTGGFKYESIKSKKYFTTLFEV